MVFSFALSTSLNLENTMVKRQWTEEEIQFLTDNYDALMDYQIGVIIGRTRSAIRHQVVRLGIADKHRPKSLEGRRKQSEAMKEITPWNKDRTDIYSEETIRRMSEAKKGIKKPEIMGKKHPYWKGGRFTHPITGYIMKYIGGGKYAYEHRLIMGQYLERKLTADEIVHHINGIRDDNRIENLRLMTRGQHTILINSGEHK